MNIIKQSLTSITRLTLILPIAISGLTLPHTAIAAEITNSQTQGAYLGQDYIAEKANYSEAELAQMLAPIALYPDSLLSHILIATTYPLDVIAAERFIEKNKKQSKKYIENKVADKDWDESVKVLTAFPQILQQLSTDLTWMESLADAFISDEGAVLASIQYLREQADKAGNLTKLSELNVERENNIIVINSPSPEVIYVPYYDTRVVYGHWRWRHYPPVYWQAPVHLTLHHGPFYWHSGIHIDLGFFFSRFHWHNKQVVINRHRYFDNGYPYKAYSDKRRTKYVTHQEYRHWRHKRHYTSRPPKGYNPIKHHSYHGNKVITAITSKQAIKNSHAQKHQVIKHKLAEVHKSARIAEKKLTTRELKKRNNNADNHYRDNKHNDKKHDIERLKQKNNEQISSKAPFYSASQALDKRARHPINKIEPSREDVQKRSKVSHGKPYNSAYDDQSKNKMQQKVQTSKPVVKKHHQERYSRSERSSKLARSKAH